MAAELGIRLKAIREFYGWSQRELAKRAGVPNSAISVIEQGTVSPSVSSLEKVLKGFPIALEDFFTINIARQKVIVNNPEAEIPVQMLFAIVEPEVTNRGLDINLKLFSTRQGEDPFNHLCRDKTTLLITSGAAVFSSLSTVRQLKAGDSLSICTPTPYRIEALTDEVQWVLASMTY